MKIRPLNTRGCNFVGWPREVALPGLPQIRTCQIRASGSSKSWTRYPTVGGVDHRWGRQRVAFEQPPEFYPVHASPVTTAVQPLAPSTLGEVEEGGDGLAITGNTEVGIVPPKLLLHQRVLLLDRQVPIEATPSSY